MRIKATETVNRDVTVTVSTPHMWDALRVQILNKFGINASWELRDDGFFYSEDEYRHGSQTYTKLLEASTKQKKVWSLLHGLQSETMLTNREFWGD